MGAVRGTVRLDERGRLLLPAELRRQLGMRAGDDLVVSEESAGVLRVESRRAAAHALIGLAGSAGDRSAIDDLRDERRREVAGQDADARRPAP